METDNSSGPQSIGGGPLSGFSAMSPLSPQTETSPLTPTSAARSTLPSSLNFPSVLRFLQAEFRRFEVKRSEWELERAELKVSGSIAGSRRVNGPSILLVAANYHDFEYSSRRCSTYPP